MNESSQICFHPFRIQSELLLSTTESFLLTVYIVQKYLKKCFIIYIQYVLYIYEILISFQGSFLLFFVSWGNHNGPPVSI